MLAGVLTQAMTDPKLKGLSKRVGEPSLHVTGIDQVRPWAAATIARTVPVLLVTATGHEAEDLAAELSALLGDERVALMPAFETLPHERLSPAADIVGKRNQVLHGLAETSVVVASARAMCQPVLPAVAPIEVAHGEEYDFEELAASLTSFAYEHVDMVSGRGEFATRGGIIDVFPTTAEHPVRIEFWGDEVTDLRTFAVADQRTIEDIARVELHPARQLLIDDAVKASAASLAEAHPGNRTLVELLTRISDGTHADGMEALIPALTGAPYAVLPELMPEGSVVLVTSPEKVRTRISDLQATDQEFLEAGWEAAAMGADGPVAAEGLDVSASSYRSFESLEVSAREAGNAWWTFAPPGMFAAGEDDEATLPLEFEAAPAPKGDPKQIEALYGQVKMHLKNGGRAAFTAPAKGTVDRMAERLRENGISARVATAGLEPVDGQVTLYQALSHAGLTFPGPGLVVFTETDVTGNRVGDIAGAKRRAPRRRNRVDPLALKPGDYVVHDTHGIGRFVKMAERTIGTGEDSSRREYIVLEYQPAKRGQPADQLWVPMESLDLLSKYSGGEQPSLSKMGGSDWKNTKKKARAAVREIAGELVQLYAKRASAPGHAFAPDSPWQIEMEDNFPFVETEDQMAAIEAVKADMEKPTPMDRVIVGDVGFGKTEVAVRAAFKAVQDGKQVAVLVPTTLLAQQHFSTFSQRMDGFGVDVKELSRFTTGADAKKIMAGLADGSVDIVIGTHRLLQTGVQWKNLGLIIVDEEQRFGVEHKEHIKALKSHVDVLTMTATPIPRTLEMSLTGIREMTSITTPPEDRHPVLTYVGPQEDKQVAAAIRRELLRDGQVFYIHNKVSDIEKTARHLRTLVPEARIVVAHGQMGEQLLEQTVQGFWNRDFDVLVCTTIVETGLDIANANTLIVENAQNMGLSQLHQLRGRVGRSRERGYAYFLYPKDKVLTETSYDRLATIAQNNDLGAGIAVAQKDLEMRGAGNVLGAEQSGHIAGVGFDMYVRLVGEAVETYKALMSGDVVDATDQGPKEIRIDLPVDAHIPETYINSERLRLESYRKLAAARDDAELSHVAEELVDRFGEMPEEVERLFAVARLRHQARRAGVADITMQGTRLKVHPVDMPDSKQVRLKRLYPGSNYRAAAKAVQVPFPREGGAKKALNAPNLRDEELLQWIADFLSEMFDVEKVSVRGAGIDKPAKKRVVSVSE
ncbi:MULTISPECIES: transcription-repair coupling factor [unclassified Corynebacterium]|uniref:transcription-repair coupling factor n=1 Tax=unclassified Corynebacterium TaxID=2624378 RepID=UPI00264EA867|nr:MULTISPECIES: transcription-repair coupling factor [unclassified Corynebacterium]MDN8594915.1 transcription-repair coupling factor [Corynebacterium sp. P4_F2]WKK56701.1 transcription-repair coupling factor [Corynebacterium sp. P4-C1]WKK64476.1 transcription-repair coupling factor [Corynebacterium sp. P8-C1]